MKKRWMYLIVAGLAALSMLLVACGDPTSTPLPAATKAATAGASGNPVQAATDLASLKDKLNTLITAVNAKDVAKAQAAYKDYDESWDKVEDNIKAVNATAYKDIEDKMGEIENLIVKPQTPDFDKGKQAVQALTDTITKYATSIGK
jgi:hypothetical protein